MNLVNTLWNFCHTLRHEGIDYSDYIEELTYLLFLKIAEERESDIPKGCRWNDLIAQDESKLLTKYNDTLKRLSQQKNILGDIFRHPIAKIRTASALKKLLTLINDINWSAINEDVLGSTFEGLLERAAVESKKGAGQYFTPRPLIETIVNVMKPDPFETSDFNISDVACGTCGFIISSFEWWKNNNSDKKLTSSKKEKLYQKTYFGQELVVRPRRMAQMNLYLHGINPLNIKLGDTIYDPLSEERFSCILTNPPFGNKGAKEVPKRTDFKIKTSNKQLNFVQHIFSSLKPNGRAAIILPDNVLFEDKAAELWQYLFEHCNVHTILKLPFGTFASYAQGVKANVIFLQKGKPTKSVWIYDARTNVNIVTKKERPLGTKHFKEFEKSYGADPNANIPRVQDKGERFREFSIEYIKTRKFRLDISWLEDRSNESEISESSTQDVLRDSIKDVKIILQELESVLKALEK